MRHSLIHHYLENRDLNELYISIAIRAFALSLISIFVPIYLLEQGFALSTVILYYILLYCSHMLFIFPAAKISAKIGFKRSIFISVVLLIVFFMLLLNISRFSILMPMTAFVYGIGNSLFWLGYHVDFCKFSASDRRGRQIGVQSIITRSMHTLGPAIGGLIITFAGFSTMFISASVLMTAAAIPLIYAREKHEPISFRLTDVFEGQRARDSLAFVGYGVDLSATVVIWPIIIFLTFVSNYAVLGSIRTLALAVSVIGTLVIARYSDLNRRLVLRIGAGLNAVVWFVRSLVRNSLQVVLVDMFGGLSRSAMLISFNALSYDKASQVFRYTIFRELMINTGHLLFFVLLYMAILLFNVGTSTTFAAGVFGSFLAMLF